MSASGSSNAGSNTSSTLWPWENVVVPIISSVESRLTTSRTCRLRGSAMALVDWCIAGLASRGRAGTASARIGAKVSVSFNSTRTSVVASGLAVVHVATSSGTKNLSASEHSEKAK